jgi:hypothetical protein
MMNKKGVDAIVATVLIIMITVAAVAIVWMTVIPMIKDTANEGITCFDAQKSLEIVREGNSCYNATSAKVQIKRGVSDMNLTALTVTFIKDGSTVGVNTIDSTAIPSVNGMEVYYNFSAGNATQASVAATIKVGQASKTCEANAPVELSACAA